MKRDERAGRAPSTGVELIWPGKRAAASPPDSPPIALAPIELVGDATPGAWRNKLVWADNRVAMRALAGELGGRVDLVYMDPPFGSGAAYTFSTRAGDAAVAYDDRWREGLGAYLSTMREQLELLRALLAPTGTVFVHCDWHVSHYLRCLLDEVFGPACFKNEIVWRYRRWPAKAKAFQRMHDVIFWYGREPGDGHAWTPLFEPLAPSTIETWGTKRQVADFSTGRRKPSQTDEETEGAPMSDVWEIGIIAPIARERLGYPTQKPEALLRRVIESATRPGDLVADFFAGSGTTLAVAEKLGRRWVGCDAGQIAIHTIRKRLAGLGATDAGRSVAPFELLAPAGSAVIAGDPGAAPFEIVADPAAPGRTLRLCLAPAVAEAADAWAVDWDHRDGVFKGDWRSARGRRGAGAALTAEATHTYDRPGSYVIAVQIVDPVGNEVRHTRSWEAMTQR